MAAGKEIRGKIKIGREHQEDHQGHGDGLGLEDAQGAGPHAPGAPVRREDSQPGGQPVAGHARVQAPVHGEATTTAKTAGFIVVTTDKGLCGGLNTNVLRAVTAKLKEQRGRRAKSEAVAIGNKGFGFLNRIGAKVVSHATHLGDQPHLDKLIGPVKVLLDAYAEGKLSAGVPLLHPLHQHDEAGAGGRSSCCRCRPRAWPSTRPSHGWDYIYEPDAAVGDQRAAGALHRGAGLPGAWPRTWRPSIRRAWWR